MQTNSRFRSHFGVGCAAVLATAGALIGMTSGAGASSLRSAKPPATSHPMLVRPVSAGAAVATAGDFGGYTAEPSAGVASASVSFTIPSVTCPANLGTGFVEIGPATYSAAAYIYVYCPGSGAAAQYDYDLTTPSGQEFRPANAGDAVVATIFETGTTTQAEIHDLTNGQYWFDNYTSDAGDSEVYIGAFTDTAIYEVPSFAPVTMSNVQINGDYLGFESPSQYNDSNPYTHHVVIASSALKTAGGGSRFRLTFKNKS
jgi:hypothetical protein